MEVFSMFWEFGYRHPGGGPRGFGRGRHGMGGPPGWWGDWFGGPPPRAERAAFATWCSTPSPSGLVMATRSSRPSKSAAKRPTGQVRASSIPRCKCSKSSATRAWSKSRVARATRSPTPGREDLAQNREYVDEFYERFAENSWDRYAADFGDVMKRVSSLMKTFRHAARRGHLTPSILTRVLKILDRTAVEIEELIEEDVAKGTRGR